MLTFAKGVGNGITLAGIVARAEIMDTIDAQLRSAPSAAIRCPPRPADSPPLDYVLENDLQANALK